MSPRGCRDGMEHSGAGQGECRVAWIGGTFPVVDESSCLWPCGERCTRLQQTQQPLGASGMWPECFFLYSLDVQEDIRAAAPEPAQQGPKGQKAFCLL